jgi:hypothetical protein
LKLAGIVFWGSFPPPPYSRGKITLINMPSNYTLKIIGMGFLELAVASKNTLNILNIKN